MSSTQTVVNSHSASALHARLQNGTRNARRAAVPKKAVIARKRPRVTEASIWRLLDHLRVTAKVAEPTLARDRALRRLLSELLEGATREDRPASLARTAGPILIVRSGPWPLLRALLSQISAWPQAPTLIVLCHHRDQAALEQMSRSTRLELRPMFYPRFEPFNPATLERLIAAAPEPWAATVVLDPARTGTSRALDHITRALSPIPGGKYVWNGGGEMFQAQSLLETLGKERYQLVRRLLRWRAGQDDSN